MADSVLNVVLGAHGQAAMRHLTTQYWKLARKYGVDGRYALVLGVVNPGAYGPDLAATAFQSAPVTS